jgi:hypothetical protein
MPFQSFNVGRDVTVNFTNPLTGAAITWGLVTDFMSSPDTKSIESSPISAPPVFADPPHGWRGSFTVDRNSSAVDAFFASLETAYWAGTTIPNATIMEYIQEINGTVSQFQYLGVSLKLDDAGSKKSQDKITQKISFRCSQRLQIQ